VGWTLFYMLVILKIPIIAAFVLVWYAIQEPEQADEEPRERLHRGGDDRPRPHRPRPPRRGPHAEPPPKSPKRTRAIGKRVERTHG
jgi:hypothetical protein